MRIAELHPREIALGLERVRAVRDRLGLARLARCQIVVGGTNGKGSTVALIEAAAVAAGHRVGAYFSPHLLRFNERIHIGGQEVDDLSLSEAFARVDGARGDIPLTYFEFATLAMAVRFQDAKLDLAVLEVGLGGRLDAVNVFDADVAIVSSIGLDHLDWLGPDRDHVGREKAGIFRAGRPAISADPAPPATIADEAARIGAELVQWGRDFGVREAGGAFEVWGPGGLRLAGLARPTMAGAHQLRNAAAAFVALSLVARCVPVGDLARQAALGIQVPGRYQTLRLARGATLVLDVAHNAEAAEALAMTLAETVGRGRTVLLLGLLKDKPAQAVVAALKGVADEWHLAGLPGARGLDAAGLAADARLAGVTGPIGLYATPEAAFEAVEPGLTADDRLVVCGSFVTVSAIMAHRDYPGILRHRP